MRKPKENDQSEWWVKKQIKKILEEAGWKAWMPAANVFGANGVSDFICVKPLGLFMAIEAKYDNIVTAQQYEFLSAVHEAGHRALLVDETNIDDLRKFLSAELYTMVDITSLLKWQNQNQVFDIRASRRKPKPEEQDI